MMSEYGEFLCDIYEDDELLHEKVRVDVLVGWDGMDEPMRQFSNKIRFKEAAEQAVEETCLAKAENNYEYDGALPTYRVIVTEVSTDLKCTVTVEIQAEETVHFSCAVIKEEEISDAI